MSALARQLQSIITNRVPQGTGRRTRHPGADHQPFGYAERSMASDSVRLRGRVVILLREIVK